jgi:hypothetical protein
MRWLLKLWIYLNGIRFYESKTMVEKAEVIRAIFQLVDGRPITFNFRFGKFTTVNTQAFVIQPDFGELQGSKVLTFNKSRYYFWSQMLWMFSDKVVADVLLELYMKFLTHHFRTTN